MIVHIRSTSGGGKTTAMRYLIECAKCGPAMPVVLASGAKTVIYQGTWKGHVFYAIGPYEQAGSGGCDRIKLVTDVAALVEDLAGEGNIVALEGLLIAHSWGHLGKTLHPKFGHRYYNFFLDTPRKTCIANVLQRRLDRGGDNPPERIAKITGNIVADYHRVNLAHARVVNKGGNRVDIPYATSGPEIADHISAWCIAKTL